MERFHVEHITDSQRKQLNHWGFDDAAIDKLQKYASLVKKWQKAINLVAPSTIPQLWERHLIDSAQLWPIIKACGTKKTDIIDLGSGGGFPGLVLAIAGADQVQMVESDTRKCVFLRETARELGLENVIVHDKRIEDVDLPPASFVTARALTALKQLYQWAHKYSNDKTHMLFLKGQDADKEMRDLPKSVQQNILAYNSYTDSNAKILDICVSRET